MDAHSSRQTRPVRRTTRLRDDRGAVAIMVAILATVLFSSAALAVDLGNSWARKREVQKQVDVAALSVGWMLPMTNANKTAIAQRIADYYNEDANQVEGQPFVTAAQLLNAKAPDGEIVFQDEDYSTCVDNCPQMTLVAPGAQVDFGLAGVMGVSNTKVQRSATVRITSSLPPRQKSIPFWLPTGCGFGPIQADTQQGGNGGNQATPTPTPTATATTTPDPTPYQPTPVGTHILNGTAVTPVANLGTITVQGWSVTGVGNRFKKVTLRAYPPTGSAFVDFAAQTTGNGSVPSFQVSTEISSVAGDWRVYALAQQLNGPQAEYSQNHLIIRVTPPVVVPSPTPTPTANPTDSAVMVGCVGQDRGNFGQLDTPRKEGGTKQERLARNIALGIDHTLAPYVFAPGVSERKECGSGNAMLPGAQLDDVSREGNNCITGDTGNDGPKIMDGLIQGIAGVAPGRLDVANGNTTCAGRSNMYQAGKLVNNDVLSCFLRKGATLETITQEDGVSVGMLDASILTSPRFVWLPVVYATDRAQKDFQPIREFVPGFITDETTTSPATADNGLEINGNSVAVLKVFTFNRDALPPLEDSDTVDYNPTVGGGVVRLVR